jgi:general secretion pathway protein N
MVLDGIAVALAGLLFLELHFATEPPDARAQRSALIAPQTQLLDGTDFSAPEPTVSIWRNMMLSRPLFDPNRRPPAPPQDPAATVEIPRLSGIMITPTERIAVFSPAMGAPIIVNQNSRFGPFTVLAISGDSVAIKGPSGVIVLRSDFGAGEGPGSSTAKSTLVAAGISLNLVRIALPNATSWPAPPPGH